jgi:hypothetical protein
VCWIDFVVGSPTVTRVVVITVRFSCHFTCAMLLVKQVNAPVDFFVHLELAAILVQLSPAPDGIRIILRLRSFGCHSRDDVYDGVIVA